MITVNANLTLCEHQGGFSFGTDALLLSAFLPARPHGIGVELGSGSGVISLLALARGAVKAVHAVEIQAVYAASDGLIAQNARQNGMTDRLLPVHADLRTLTASHIGGEVDLCFANPPYFKADSGRTAQGAVRDSARRENHGDIGDFCRAAARLLKHGGIFSVVYRPDRLCDLLCAMREADLEPKQCVLVARDALHAPFAVLAQGKKGAAASMQTELLYLYGADGAPTAQYLAIQEGRAWKKG